MINNQKHFSDKKLTERDFSLTRPTVVKRFPFCNEFSSALQEKSSVCTASFDEEDYAEESNMRVHSTLVFEDETTLEAEVTIKLLNLKFSTTHFLPSLKENLQANLQRLALCYYSCTVIIMKYFELKLSKRHFFQNC